MTKKWLRVKPKRHYKRAKRYMIMVRYSEYVSGEIHRGKVLVNMPSESIVKETLELRAEQLGMSVAEYFRFLAVHDLRENGFVVEDDLGIGKIPKSSHHRSQPLEIDHIDHDDSFVYFYYKDGIVVQHFLKNHKPILDNPLELNNYEIIYPYLFWPILNTAIDIQDLYHHGHTVRYVHPVTRVMIERRTTNIRRRLGKRKRRG